MVEPQNLTIAYLVPSNSYREPILIGVVPADTEPSQITGLELIKTEKLNRYFRDIYRWKNNEGEIYIDTIEKYVKDLIDHKISRHYCDEH